jgi:hypothetical protein
VLAVYVPDIRGAAAMLRSSFLKSTFRPLALSLAARLLAVCIKASVKVFTDQLHRLMKSRQRARDVALRYRQSDARSGV